MPRQVTGKRAWRLGLLVADCPVVSSRLPLCGSSVSRCISRYRSGTMRLTIFVAAVLGAVVWAQAPATVPVQQITRGAFSFAYDERGISQLKNPDDPFGAVVTTPAPAGRGGRGGATPGQPQRAATLGLTIAYQAGGKS